MYAAVAQSVERILGKDEVGSSNLPSSSKIPLESLDSGGISLVFVTFETSLFLRFFIDPHRDPHGEMSGKGQRASGRKICLPAWLFCTFIPKFEPHSGDFDDLLLIGFDKTHLED